MNTEGKKLSVKEIEAVMGWSYPTALTFATEHGELEKSDRGRGKWYVSYDIIQGIVNDKIAESQRMQIRLFALNGSRS